MLALLLSVRRLAVATLLLGAISACGYKGDLTLSGVLHSEPMHAPTAMA